MALGERRLAAAFFIPRPDREWSLEQLAQTAGIEDPFIVTSHPYPLHGRWAGMEDSLVRLDILQFHYCFQIYFWLSAFFELGDKQDNSDSQQDGTLQVAYKFRDACSHLRAQVAFIVSHLDQAEPDYILDKYTDVLGMSGNALVNAHYGLLYLNQDMMDSLNSGALLSSRDSLQVTNGLLVFSGSGAKRWS
jgi:hypothetical protein